MSSCFCPLWVSWALGINLIMSQHLASLAPWQEEDWP